MITRLFRNRKRLDSADPADRIAALEAFSEEEAREDQPALAALALGDPDTGVRRAALKRLHDPEALSTLLDDDTLAEAAADRAAQLVNAGQAAALAGHPAVLRARLAANPSADLLRTVLAADDPGVLVDAVLVCPREHKDTLLEHPAFLKADVLSELERRSRDHDKRTNRFARSRLDTLRRERAEAATISARAEERLAVLEKPTTDNTETESRRRHAMLDAVTADLAALEALAATLGPAGEPPAALDTLRHRHGALQAARPAPAPRPASPAAGTQPAPVVAFASLTLAFEALDRAMSESDDFEALAAERQRLTDQWLAGADHSPPSGAEHAVFERVSHRFHELAEAQERLAAARLPTLDGSRIPETLSVETPPEADVLQAVERLRRDAERAVKVLSGLRWPQWAPPAPAIAGYRETLAGAEARLERWNALVGGLATDIDARLERLGAAVEAGELKEARSEAGEIRNRLKSLPRHLARSRQRSLGQASARLSELSDWQTYATSPKRESLAEAMLALAEQPLPPRDQAERIKALRAEWNQLGPVSNAADHRLQSRFNEAAERAFEPCRGFFAELAEERARNLEARKEICNALATYIEGVDWGKADYKAAEQIMRAARQEWRNLHPVDRTPGKPVEERFETLQQVLHDHIKAEWDRNLAEKQRIVEEAQAIAGSDADPRDKVTNAKHLQQRWTSVGITPRRPDQNLWRDFRKACDAIFTARDAAQRSADETISGNQHQAEAVIESFRAFLDDEDAALDPASLRDFQKRFDELPRLPDRLFRPLERSFAELMRSARLALKDARSAAERQRLKDLQGQDAAVAALEQRHRAGEAVSFEPPDELFAGRWEQVDDAVPMEALHRLVIETEIAAEIRSPEADRERRMAIQVELMNAGRSREALTAEPAALTARWCAQGPKDAAVDPLRERFFAAIDQLSRR